MKTDESQQIAIFQDNEVRIVKDDPVTVVLKDVADALGYRGAHRLKRSIKDKYLVPHDVGDAADRKQKMICVTRPGISQALATLQPRDEDKKAKVESFQDWLYEDVLESIYDEGGYQAEKMTPIQALAQTTQQMGKGVGSSGPLESTK